MNKTFHPIQKDRELFKKAQCSFKGKNFMTPTVLEYYTDNKGNFCELSTGTGFEGSKIFGCTFSGKDYDQNDNSLNQCFQTIKQAKDYIGGI